MLAACDPGTSNPDGGAGTDGGGGSGGGWQLTLTANMTANGAGAAAAASAGGNLRDLDVCVTAPGTSKVKVTYACSVVPAYSSHGGAYLTVTAGASTLCARAWRACPRGSGAAPRRCSSGDQARHPCRQMAKADPTRLHWFDASGRRLDGGSP